MWNGEFPEACDHPDIPGTLLSLSGLVTCSSTGCNWLFITNLILSLHRRNHSLLTALLSRYLLCLFWYKNYLSHLVLLWPKTSAASYLSCNSCWGTTSLWGRFVLPAQSILSTGPSFAWVSLKLCLQCCNALKKQLDDTYKGYGREMNGQTFQGLWAAFILKCHDWTYMRVLKSRQVWWTPVLALFTGLS